MELEKGARAVISFKVSKQDSALIDQIVERALLLARRAGEELDRLELHMDITAAHANGSALRLSEMLAADDFNFAHDVFGIRRHIDRKTGKLADFFVPRFARPEVA
jgi:hypothetical protein